MLGLRRHRSSGDPKGYHKNARLTVFSLEKLAKAGLQAGERQYSGEWVRRYREQSVADLGGRDSRLQRLHRSTLGLEIEQVEVLRRECWTGYRIARDTGLSRSTVSRILCRLKLHRMRDLDRHRLLFATNILVLAACYSWTSSAWCASPGRRTVLPATAGTRFQASVPSSSTSPTVVWPSLSSTRMKPALRCCTSCTGHWTSTSATASTSARAHRDRLQLPLQRLRRPLSQAWPHASPHPGL